MIKSFRMTWLLSYLSIASVSAAIITPALPQISLAFDLVSGEVEWVVSFFLIGYTLGQLIYGPLANRWGRVFALRTGLIINIVGIMLCIASISFHAYWLLLSGRLLSALGAASGLSCTFMLINEWLPEEQRKTAMAYSILSFTLGIGLAVVVGGLITAYGEWTYCFAVLLLQGIIMLLGTYAFGETLKHPQRINVSTIVNGYKRTLRSETLVIFAIAVGFCTLIGYCFSAAAPQIADELLHLSADEYGYWNLVNVAGMLAGGLWSKRLLMRFTAIQVVVAGLVVCAMAIISLLLMWKTGANSALWFFTSTMGLYLFSSLIFSGASYIASNALSDKANGSAMMSFINMLTATIAVMLMNFLASNTLLAFVEILIGAWLLVAGLLAFREIYGKTTH
ncbi:MAG: MFS transporter [Legionella sp.]|nr:MFS transporter [Legionella sp.]